MERWEAISSQPSAVGFLMKNVIISFLIQISAGFTNQRFFLLIADRRLLKAISLLRLLGKEAHQVLVEDQEHQGQNQHHAASLGHLPVLYGHRLGPHPL